MVFHTPGAAIIHGLIGAAYLLDLVTEKSQSIISHYLELIGIIDLAIVIGHQVDKTKTTVSDFISGLLDDLSGSDRCAKKNQIEFWCETNYCTINLFTLSTR